MQKVGPLVLLLMLVFALVFALLPTGEQAATQTGATLQGVRLTLYPSRDPEAIWQFQAAQVSSDPLSGTTVLSGLSGGQRLLRQKSARGEYTGQTTLDATLRAPGLTIDGQDNLLTPAARLTLVRECATIDLRGTPQQPVKIEQGVGFSAPRTRLDAPALRAQVRDLQMDFQFNILASGPMELTGNLDSTERCVNGQRVTSGPTPPRRTP